LLGPQLDDELQTPKSKWVQILERVLDRPDIYPSATFSREQLIEALKQADEDIDGRVTLPAYQCWRASQPDCTPSKTTIICRLGEDNTWSSSQVVADVERPGPEYACRAMATAMEDLGSDPSFAAYRSWRQDQEQTWPTTGTLKKYLDADSWSEVNQRAREYRGAASGGENA
jgi:hypothetical protein